MGTPTLGMNEDDEIDLSPLLAAVENALNNDEPEATEMNYLEAARQATIATSEMEPVNSPEGGFTRPVLYVCVSLSLNYTCNPCI